MANELLPPLTDNLRAIFVDSNIGTHLAVVVSLYDTITNVKAKIAAEHALCFQDIGEITVEAIKVRRRGFFYNLADSMYILNAFDRIKGCWFVRIEAVPMCTVKDQKVIPNNVTHEQPNHHDYTVPLCSVDKHQEIVSCGLSSKNSVPGGQESHNPSMDLEHRPTMLIDQEKDGLRKDESNNLCNEASDAMPSATCTHKRVSSKRSKTSQHEKLLESQSQHYLVEKKRGGKNLKDGSHEEINCDGKKEIMAASSEGLLSKLPHENIKSLQNSSDKKHAKKRKSKSSKSHEEAHPAMPSGPAVVVISPQVTTDPQNSGKEANDPVFSGKCPTEPNIERDIRAMHDTASFLEATNQKETKHSAEENKESVEEQILQVNPEDQNEQHVNSSQYTNAVVTLKQPGEAKVFSQVVSEFPTKLYCIEEGLQSKLLDENTTSLQNPSVEKHTKKRKRKSSKSQEETLLVLPYGTAIVKSPQLTADLHNSEKETDASFFSGKYHTEPSIEESLANDKKHVSTSHDATSFLEVPNKKERRHSLEINKEHNLQVNSEDQSNKHVISVQNANVGVSLKELAEAGVSLQVASESPTKLYHDTAKSKSQSSKILKSKEANDQKNRGSEATKCVRDLNFVEAGYVGAKAGTSASAEKFPYQEQATDALSILKGANKNCNSTKVDSKGQIKSQRSRKRSKAESNAAKIIKQADHEANGGHSVDTNKISSSSKKVPNPEEISNVSFANPPISIPNNISEASHAYVEQQAAETGALPQASSEVQAKQRRSKKKPKIEPSKLGSQENFDSAKIIKQADQEANGGHSVDTIKISSSSKKVPNPDEISNVSFANPPISIHISEVSHAYVEGQQAAETGAPSQAPSEVQAKQRRSKKKPKIEPSKLRSQENFDSVLPKSNGEVTESNDERWSYLSKLANESSQKKELHCMDARVKAHLSDENSSKLVNAGQVDPSEASNYRLQDFTEQSNAEILIKGHVSQYEALAGPTKSMHDRKKSKEETLIAQVSSEISEPMGICRPDESTIKFYDYFVPSEGKHSPAVHTADPPSQKSKSRKKNKTCRKTDESQPYQDSPTNVVQPSSYKQHMPIVQPLENETIKNSGNGKHAAETKDSETETVLKAKNTKQSTKQNSPLHKAHDKHKLRKKLQNYEPESHVQLLKSGVIGNKQGKKITADGKEKARSIAPDRDIDNVVDKHSRWYEGHHSLATSNPVGDPIGSNNFEVSQSEAMVTEVASSDSTEDMSYQKKRYRLVRKISSRKSKKVTNNSNPEKSLLVPSGGIFSVASITSSESESDAYKKKGAIKTTAVDDDSSISGDSDGQHKEIQTNASALKLKMDTNSFGAESEERDETSKEADGGTKNHNHIRSDDASTQKMPLSYLLRSSMSYRKSKLSATLKSEFTEAENQPIDVVLETQPESAAPSPS